MSRRLLALYCALLLLLPACKQGGEAGQSGNGGYQVYFAVPFGGEGDPGEAGGTAVASEIRRLPEGADIPGGLMECLLSGPVPRERLSVRPEGVYLLSQPTVEEGVCRVNLSEKYGGLSGVELTLADYCIVLTLCQVPGVEAVSIDVEGSPIPYRDRQLLRSSDVVLSGGEDQPLYLTVKLFFPRRSGGLAAEERNVLLTEQDTPVTAVLNALLSGPETQGLFFLFPEEAHILSAWVENGNCYVDFDAPFLDREPESAAQAQQLLYAIVNTLCQLPDVGAVQILVEGEAPERYGEIPTSSPLEANKDLVVD